MDLESQLLFFFSAIGVFNGFLLSIYFLYFIKEKHISNYFLGGLLLALSIRILKSVFFYFYPDLPLNFLQVGLSACFFIGPMLYMYVESMQPSYKKGKNHHVHLTIITLTVIIFGALYPYPEYPTLWRTSVFKVIYYQWLFYIIISGFKLKHLFLKKETFESYETWLISIYFGNVIICIAYFTTSYTSYIVGALSFTFVFYILILLLVFRKMNKSIQIKPQKKYGEKRIESDEAERLIVLLRQLMETEHMYLESSVSLSSIAKRMSLLPQQLSQLINRYHEKRFSDYINEHRIEHAKKLILENPHLTIEAVSERVGFNSNTTFYNAFKKLTGITPAKFKATKL